MNKVWKKRMKVILRQATGNRSVLSLAVQLTHSWRKRYDNANS